MNPLPPILARAARNWGRRYVQFCVVGASGLVVDMVVLHFLAVRWGWDLTLSKMLAAETALLSNFYWNEVWTFRGLDTERGWRGRLRRVGRFHLICLAGMVWGVVLLRVQVEGLGWNVYLANLISIGLVSVWNFGLNLKFGWQHSRAGKITQSDGPV